MKISATHLLRTLHINKNLNLVYAFGGGDVGLYDKGKILE